MVYVYEITRSKEEKYNHVDLSHYDRDTHITSCFHTSDSVCWSYTVKSPPFQESRDLFIKRDF